MFYEWLKTFRNMFAIWPVMRGFSKYIIPLVEDIRHLAGEGMFLNIVGGAIFLEMFYHRSKLFCNWTVRRWYKVFISPLVKDIWHLSGEQMFSDIKYFSRNVFTIGRRHLVFGR